MVWLWFKRLGLSAIALAALLIFTGVSYQFIGAIIDDYRYPPPGTLVDVGGFRLHLYSLGKGGPTVILDSGLGCNALDWTLVQSEIAKFTRVCSYDRAGYGWSDESPFPRTSEQIVQELHTLLVNAHVPGPYILVGHSFGGNNVRLYASRYPHEVAGIVLVDATHERLTQQFPRELFDCVVKWTPRKGLWMAYSGFLRLLLQFGNHSEWVQQFPLASDPLWIAKMVTNKKARAMYGEAIEMEESLRQLERANHHLGEIPLTVVSAGKASNGREWGMPSERDEWLHTHCYPIWMSLQEELVGKSSSGKQMIAEKSGHMIPWQQPETIVEAVREMIGNAVRERP